MTKTTILGEDITVDDQSTQTEETQPAQQDDTYLQTLVGEGKKYKSTEELAKAYANADPYISELKEKVTTLEAEVNKAKTIDDIINTIKPEIQPTEPTPQTSDSVDIDAWYENKQKEERIKTTQEESWNKLATLCGGDKNKAKTLVSSIVGDDQTMADVINKLGSYSPDKFVKFIESQTKGDDVQFTDTGNIAPTSNSTGNELTWSQAKKVRKENPRLYRSQEFQRKIQAAMDANNNFFKE